MPSFAKDRQTGFLIPACKGIRKRKYICYCPEAHDVCLRKGLKNIAHFAHIPISGQNGDIIPSCSTGGESEIHIQAKHKLVEWQGKYKFALKTCEICRDKVMEDCCDGAMQIEVRGLGVRWRYDVLFTRQDGTQLALEVNHTHSTGDDKVESSTMAGIPVAEFDAESILSLQQGGILDNLRDMSWICSQQCRELKVSRERDEKLRAQRLEDQKRRVQQQEELKRHAREQELAAALQAQERLRVAMLQAQQQKQATQMLRETGCPAESKRLLAFACINTSSTDWPALFHALNAISAERCQVNNMDYIMIRMPDSSFTTESVRAALDSFGIRLVSSAEGVADILTLETSTREQRQAFFRHIKYYRLLDRQGKTTPYWAWRNHSK
jgi:hypothetical protein